MVPRVISLVNITESLQCIENLLKEDAESMARGLQLDLYEEVIVALAYKGDPHAIAAIKANRLMFEHEQEKKNSPMMPR